MHAAVFSPDQMHRISAYEIRNSMFFGPLLSTPFSVPSHYALVLSMIGNYLNVYVIEDPLLRNCFLPDRLALYLFLFELTVVLICFEIVLIMSHTKSLTGSLHVLKKLEGSVNR